MDRSSAGDKAAESSRSTFGGILPCLRETRVRAASTCEPSPNRVRRSFGQQVKPKSRFTHQIHLRLAVVSTAGNVVHAREKNAKRTTAPIARLRELLTQDADPNGELLIDPQLLEPIHREQHNRSSRARPIIYRQGHRCRYQGGANMMSGVESSALDEQLARSEALKQATIQAKANAEAMAAALGLRWWASWSAETSAAPVPPRDSHGCRT